MAFSTTASFLTDISGAEVWGYSQYTATSTSVPTLTQVETFANDIAGIIVMQTERAGQRHTPPASGISDTYLRAVLTSANAIGTAFYQRHGIWTLNGDENSLRIMQSLAGLWQMYMGEGSAQVTAGIPAIQLGDGGGALAQAIESASDSRLLVTPVSQGEVTLEDLVTRTQAMTFTIEDID